MQGMLTVLSLSSRNGAIYESDNEVKTCDTGQVSF